MAVTKHIIEARLNQTIISVGDYSGAWSKPYLDKGYTVFQVDPKLKTGVGLQGQFKFGTTVEHFVKHGYYLGRNVVGLLLAPPCTHFTISGAQYWRAKDADGRTDELLEIVDACLKLVEVTKPRFWALENPVGRLPKLRPEIGKPWYWQPHWFGDAYTKKTGLWGNFSNDLVRDDVEPIRVSKQGSWLMKLGGSSERTKELRSFTPSGFSQAFCDANP